MPLDLPYPGRGSSWCVLCNREIGIGAMYTGIGTGGGDASDGHFAHRSCYDDWKERNPQPPPVFVDGPGGPFGPPAEPKPKPGLVRLGKKAKPAKPEPKRKSVYDWLRKPAI